MSWRRRPLARDSTFAGSVVQLVFSGSNAGSRIAPPWVCRQCQSQLQLQRSQSTRPDSRIVTLHQKRIRGVTAFPPRRSASDDAKRRTREENEDGVHAELPSHEEQRRSTITKRFSSVMDNLQANIFFAGQRLNDLTGYSGIEKLKQEIEKQERGLRAAQDQLAAAKSGYTAAIQQRSDSQREVNELLQRKNSWSPQDLERFTSLYRNDHANEQAETEAQNRLNEAERASEEASAKLNSQILRRYHEEQVWSDKIRRMSTWGTWGLMGVNVLLFLIFQIGVEPWRRKRLVRGFEEKVIEALETQNQHSNKVTGEALAALQATHIAATADGMVDPAEVENITDQVVSEEVAAETQTAVREVQDTLQPAAGYEVWLHGLEEYKVQLETSFSEEEILVRRVDLTKKLLEGAFVGVMLTSIIAALIRGR